MNQTIKFLLKLFTGALLLGAGGKLMKESFGNAKQIIDSSKQ